MSARKEVQALRDLAELSGVHVGYDDVQGVRREAAPESLMAVLSVLGIPVSSLRDAAGVLRERSRALSQRCIEPVTIAWDGRLTDIPLRMPASADISTIECRLFLENGEQRRWSKPLRELASAEGAEIDGAPFGIKRLLVSEQIPLGYHRLVLDLQDRPAETLVIAAPTRAYAPQGHGWQRSWGVFLPLYALHTQHSAGAGDFDDLRALTQWVEERGGGFVGTLPLLAAFLDEPFEPSPYSPASRLFWNELYLNLRDVAGRTGISESSLTADAGSSAQAFDRLRAGSLVDYRTLMSVKRRFLEAAAQAFFSGPAEQRQAFDVYVAARPRLEDYASFRAAGEKLRLPWSKWPDTLRQGTIPEGQYDARAKRYHLFVQWLCDLQLAAASSPAGGAAKNAPRRLYLDLPLGVNADGYDVWREREAFAVGVSGGCPPDIVFPKGQNWGFVPLHPQGIRAQGYRYVRDFLRHQLRHAGVLRIDHMASFHRVFWIPPGMEARDGVYVRYPAEELYAVFCLESRRHQTVLVGEDLGTVPPEVPASMARHNVHRMYVVQYEAKPDAGMALPDPPAASIAAVNTHDMPPFAAYWSGADIRERKDQGLITGQQASEEERARQDGRDALIAFLRGEGRLGEETGAREVLRACLDRLCDGPSRFVMLNLEDLWQETAAQNLPSTSGDYPNWSRKARHSFEEFTRMPEVLEIIAVLRRSVSRTAET